MINCWKNTKLLNQSVNVKIQLQNIELFVQTKYLCSATPKELVQNLEDNTYIDHLSKIRSTHF